MPATHWDWVKGGIGDMRADKLHASAHSIKRAIERKIPIDTLLQKPSGAHGAPHPVQIGNTIVTTYLNVPKPKMADTRLMLLENSLPETIVCRQPLVNLSGSTYRLKLGCISEICPFIIGKNHVNINSIASLVMGAQTNIHFDRDIGAFKISSKSMSNAIFIHDYINSLIKLAKKDDGRAGGRWHLPSKIQKVSIPTNFADIRERIGR